MTDSKLTSVDSDLQLINRIYSDIRMLAADLRKWRALIASCVSKEFILDFCKCGCESLNWNF